MLSGGARDGTRAPSLDGAEKRQTRELLEKIFKTELLLLKIHYCVASNFDNHHCNNIKFRIITIVIITTISIVAIIEEDSIRLIQWTSNSK